MKHGTPTGRCQALRPASRAHAYAALDYIFSPSLVAGVYPTFGSTVEYARLLRWENTTYLYRRKYRFTDDIDRVELLVGT